MRTIVQRFAALAMAIALVLGMTGIASAQTSDTEVITVSATVGGYIQVSVNDNSVELGTLDSFGFGSYLPGAVTCFDASTSEGASGAIYRAATPTIVTVKSTRSYSLALTTSGDVDNFIVFDGTSCTSPSYSFATVNNVVFNPAGGPTPASGTQQTFYFGAQIPLGEPNGPLTSTFTGVYTANAI